MEWLLLLLGGGAAAIGGRRWFTARSARRERAEVLAQMVKLCEEDVTLLGEQLRRVETEVADLDPAAQRDYQQALDGYESAGRQAARAADDDVLRVTETLNDARYALACVHARIAGEPRPEKRPPCFFNPQHGPSVEDVMFTPRAAGTRRVPACARDAARVKAGDQPDIRTIEVGGRKIDYFDPRAIARFEGHRVAMTSLMGSAGYTGINDGGGGGW